jgi:hypothetical protein
VHQPILKLISGELAAQGATTNLRVNKNSKGEWTIVLNDNSDVYIYTLFISEIERKKNAQQGMTDIPKNKGALVIVDPSGSRDSVGGYHPGYWLTEQYVNFLSENQKELFMQTVHQITYNTPSENYTVNTDGSISIHVNRKDQSSIVVLTCLAKWI